LRTIESRFTLPLIPYRQYDDVARAIAPAASAIVPTLKLL
jgi:hypothetical protein